MDTTETYKLTKNCSKCGLEKHLYDFSVDQSIKSGRRSYCKRCQSLYNISHPYDNNPIKRKDYDEKYKLTEAYKAKHREDSRKHRLKFPKKVRARLVSLFLSKKPCEICGERKVEAHHEDYDKPLKVRWLCKKHHEEAEHGHKPTVY